MSRFIISGGGTGGHVFPAIAIAQAIKRLEPEADILFIGAKGRLEMEKVPAAGFPIEGLVIAGFIRRVTWKNLTFPFKLAGSLLKARSIIRKFRPDVVIGVGGYASGPTLRMASSLSIPCLIQEQNSFPGVTNRLLGPRVQTVCVAYEGMGTYFPKEKIVLTGNPVRKDLVSLPIPTPKAYEYFQLDPVKKTVLILGGSGGAKSINEAMLAWIQRGIPDNIQLLWQTGKHYYENIKVQGSKFKVLLPFIDRMDLAYSCADLIVSRSGAIAISEFCLVGKPVILVPSPNVAEDHQTKNALALVHKEAAVMIRDQEIIGKLPEVVSGLLGDPAQQERLRRNILELGIPDAADRIAKEVFKLAPNNSKHHGS
ncbi:MAG: undecaprenyldiphospho-muramoylpentapeptide beta-N-acetylglucosaminyltransferase [bacterium]